MTGRRLLVGAGQGGGPGLPRTTARQIGRAIAELRARALADPPSRGGLVLAYVIAVAVLGTAMVGGGVLVGLQAWTASSCLPSGRPLDSADSVTEAALVVGAILLAYCLGCAAYFWSIGAATMHSKIWLIIAAVVAGMTVWVSLTVKGQPCS